MGIRGRLIGEGKILIRQVGSGEHLLGPTGLDHDFRGRAELDALTTDLEGGRPPPQIRQPLLCLVLLLQPLGELAKLLLERRHTPQNTSTLPCTVGCTP